ncbi:MAG: hypothetical protein ACFB10_23220 [Salibacteraceae bacterium]
MNRYRYISNIEFPQQASANHREVVLASRGIPLVRLSPTQLQELLLQSVRDVAKRSGIAGRLFLSELSETLSKLVMQEYAHFSPEDLYLAFRETRQVRQEGKLKAQTLHACLKKYQRHRDRVLKEQEAFEASVRMAREADVNQRKTATRYQLKQRLITEYATFVITDEYQIQDYGNVRYDYLDKLKLIPFSNEQKLAFIDEAREAYFEGLQRQRRKASGIEQERLHHLLIQRKCNKKQVISLAKKLALQSYLRELKQTCANLEQLIRDREPLSPAGFGRS